MILWNSIKYKYLAKAYYWLHQSKLSRPAMVLFRDINNKIAKKKRIAFYSQFLKKGDLCFDIGANIGNRTEIFLDIGCPVVAVEPQKECIDYMKKKFIDRSEIIFVQKAIDAEIGEKELFMCPVDYTSSMSQEWISALKQSGRCESYDWKQVAKVPTTTLDELISTHGKPAFCKIDVEGFELNVLRGLTKAIPFLSFEFTQECLDNAKKCIEYLSSLGNPVFNFSYGELMELVLHKWVETSEMIDLLKTVKERTSGDIYVRFRD